jgi:cytidylate kinase
MIITIDGPSASGKSTVARVLARKLNFYYIYSGLLFRAIAYVLMKEYGYTVAMMANPDEMMVKKILDPKKLIYRYEQGNEKIIYNGHDITALLKTPEMDQAASILSTHPLVREELLQLQRIIANEHDVIIDGRDAGSLVFPYADKKFYLTASLQERARRWQQALEKRGTMMTLQTAHQELHVRDTRDMNRQIAPLIIPAGAVMIDNSDLTLQETLHVMLNHIER